MDISIFLAKVIGLYLFIFSIVLYVNMKKIKNIINDTNGPLFMFVSGSTALVVGLLIVLSHNIWEADWKGLITLIGWLLLVKGSMRLLFAEATFKIMKKIMHSPVAYGLIDLIILILGVYLSYVGFMVG